MTSAGVSAGTDLALHVIREDFGAAVGAEVARRMVASPHREGGQAQFIERPAQSSTPTNEDPHQSLEPTRRWALERLAEPRSARAPSPAASARRPAPRRCSGCSPSGSSRRAACSRRATCRSTRSPGGPASAPPPPCATTSAARPRPAPAPTGARSGRSFRVEAVDLLRTGQVACRPPIAPEAQDGEADAGQADRNQHGPPLSRIRIAGLMGSVSYRLACRHR